MSTLDVRNDINNNQHALNTIKAIELGWLKQ